MSSYAVVVCDRCGIETNVSERKVTSRIEIKPYQTTGVIITKDLCEGCASQLFTWLKQKGADLNGE